MLRVIKYIFVSFALYYLIPYLGFNMDSLTRFVYIGFFAVSCFIIGKESTAKDERHIVKPTVQHCKKILAGDVGTIPLRQHYNWFLIKYGSIFDGKIATSSDSADFSHIVKYTLWCQRFIEENNHDQKSW